MLTSRQIVAVSSTGIAALIALVIWNEHRLGVKKREAEAAHERQHQLELVALRHACGLAPDAVVHEVPSIQGECQRVLLEEWRWPGAASFPGMFDDDGSPESVDGCVSVYRSWMDAPTASGKNMRQRYSCSYDPRTGAALIKLL